MITSFRSCDGACVPGISVFGDTVSADAVSGESVHGQVVPAPAGRPENLLSTRKLPHALKRALLAFSLGLGLLGTSVSRAEPKFVDDDPAEVQLEGKKAPDFTLTTLDGKSITLSKLKGKVVLLDFWASWCGPCRRSMPHLEETWNRYKDKGLVVIGINVDKEQDKAQAFLAKLGGAAAFHYPLALDPRGKVMGAYKVMQMPTAYLIGKDGVVKERIVGFSDDIAAKTATSLEALLK